MHNVDLLTIQIKHYCSADFTFRWTSFHLTAYLIKNEIVYLFSNNYYPNQHDTSIWFLTCIHERDWHSDINPVCQQLMIKQGCKTLYYKNPRAWLAKPYIFKFRQVSGYIGLNGLKIQTRTSMKLICYLKCLAVDECSLEFNMRQHFIAILMTMPKMITKMNK